MFIVFINLPFKAWAILIIGFKRLFELFKQLLMLGQLSSLDCRPFLGFLKNFHF